MFSPLFLFSVFPFLFTFSFILLIHNPAFSGLTGNPGAAPGIPTAPVAKSVARFGNLKAKAVKAIVRRKTSRMKQEIALKDEHVAEDHQSTLISASILNSMRKKMITNAPTRLRDFRETTDNYAATARHGDNRAVPPPTTTYKPHEPDAPRDGSQLSHSKPANSNLRRWGNSRSIRHHESDSTLQHLRFHKLSADNGFFSKKTFRELGCSEHVIESLKAQNFLRPSHIQVYQPFTLPISKKHRLDTFRNFVAVSFGSTCSYCEKLLLQLPGVTW